MAKHLGFLAHMTLWVKCSSMIDVCPAFILLSVFNFDFFSRNTGLISVKLGLIKENVDERDSSLFISRVTHL